MNKAVVGIIAFIFGAGAGTLVTYKVLNKKYQQIAKEEIDSVKELYSRKSQEAADIYDDFDEQRRAANIARNKEDISKYMDTIKEAGYAEEVAEPDPDIIYISAEEFGMDEDYEQVSLTYYADGVLADEEDDAIDNFVDLVGNFTTHFDEYEEDVVYVRNDYNRTYYEIVKDDQVWSDDAR